jgi:hypothetical protein
MSAEGRRRRTLERWIELVSGAVLLTAIVLVVAALWNGLYSTKEPNLPDQATVAAVSHDGLSSHQLMVYLCVDPTSDTVDGTVVIRRSDKYLNLNLPGDVDRRTSLGFLSFSRLGEQRRTPGCLNDPKVRRLAAKSYGDAENFAGKTDVVSFWNDFNNIPKLPGDVARAFAMGFRVVIAPSPTQDLTPISFRWQGVQHRSWSERFVRLDFSTIAGSFGTYEAPSNVLIFLPSNASPINPPSAAVLSPGRSGIHVFDVPVRGEDPTLEIAWIDQAWAGRRDLALLGGGILLGICGGIVGGMAFGPPRWVSWLADRIEEVQADEPAVWYSHALGVFRRIVDVFR